MEVAEGATGTHLSVSSLGLQVRMQNPPPFFRWISLLFFLQNDVTTEFLERDEGFTVGHDRRKGCRLFMSRATILQPPPTHFCSSTISPVETSDHAISIYLADGFFSHVALCRNGTSTHENTHGRLFKDIRHSLLFSFSLAHSLSPSNFPSGELLENRPQFSTS